MSDTWSIIVGGLVLLLLFNLLITCLVRRRRLLQQQSQMMGPSEWNVWIDGLVGYRRAFIHADNKSDNLYQGSWNIVGKWVYRVPTKIPSHSSQSLLLRTRRRSLSTRI